MIRGACALGNLTLEALIDAVVEGATEAEAVAEASRALIRGGGVLYDAACASGPKAHGYTSARLPSADPLRRFERGRHVSRRLLRILRRLFLRLRALAGRR